MQKSHDLSLPEWGPYSKRFFGISHRADALHGHRFDLTVMPQLFHRTLGIPDALRNNQYLPWLASPDLRNYSFRQQLEWKDRLFVDVAFVELSDQVRLIRCNCVNRTDLPKDFGIHLFAAMELNPQEKTWIRLPEGGLWLDAVRLGKVRFATERVTDALNADGMHRGEMRSPLAIHGSFLGRNFGAEAGDSLTLPLPRPAQEGERLFIRYRSQGPSSILWQGEAVCLPTRESFGLEPLPLGAGSTCLTLLSASSQAIDVDGFALLPEGAEPEIIPLPGNRKPLFSPGREANSYLVHYEGIAPYYGLWWGFDSDFIRHYAMDDFNKFLYYNDQVNHGFLEGYDRLGGHDDFLDAVLQPIPVRPGEERVVYAVVADGAAEDIGERLASVSKRPEDLEAAYVRGMAACVRFPESPWAFSQERMAAVMLTNVVYPIYTADQYIRHHTPGRQWNSLYTWDSGFTGLGFLEMDLTRAAESLNTYLTEPGDGEKAFIQHGSMVPVQIYLFYELWNRTGDDRLARAAYPSVKQYYDFMVGRHPRSVTRRRSKAAIICPWDYNYNSGGWDDYPPQWEVHRTGAKNNLPMVTTSHLIRGAKMLTFVAEALGLEGDARQFREDIQAMTGAIQQYAWDPEAGVFSYVSHDDRGNPRGFYRAADGSNFNQGLDGLSPLLAGAVTAEQRKLFWEKLQSPRHFWSPAGLSTVDQSASYFREDGYWNGSVWFPYMYFFWKAALNDGEADFAWKLASTALQVWERETHDAYACYEHFHAQSGQGMGWHHFSALSSPAVIFHAAYAAPQRLTCGNDWHCGNVAFAAQGMEADLSSMGEAGTKSMLVVNLPNGRDYEAEGNGRMLEIRRRRPGCFEVMVTHQRQLHLTVR